MKKLLSIVLIAFLCLSFSLSALAEYALDNDGNATCESALGFTFKVDDVNGEITGEDTTLVTTNAGVLNIKSIWATWFTAEKVADGIYKAITNGTAMGGTAPDVTLSDGQIMFVVHSSSSRPSEADKYPNWEAKVVARAVKAGDFIVFSDGINIDEGTGSGFMKIVTEEEAYRDDEKFPEIPEEPSESTEESLSYSEEEDYFAPETSDNNEASESDVIKIPVGDRGNGFPDWLLLVIGTILLCAGVVVVIITIMWKPKSK